MIPRPTLARMSFSQQSCRNYVLLQPLFSRGGGSCNVRYNFIFVLFLHYCIHYSQSYSIKSVLFLFLENNKNLIYNYQMKLISNVPIQILISYKKEKNIKSPIFHLVNFILMKHTEIFYTLLYI